MIFVGVDIGYSNTGIVAVQIPSMSIIGGTVISTKRADKKYKVLAASDDIARIKSIVDGIRTFLGKYKAGTNMLIGVEMPHAGAQSAKANRGMGIATGIAVTLFECLDIPVDYVTPYEVKNAVCGKRSAKKEAVKAGLAEFFLPADLDVLFSSVSDGQVEHLADALGVAVHCIKYSELFRLLTTR